MNRMDRFLNLIILNTITMINEMAIKTRAPTDTRVKFITAFVSHHL